MLQIMIVYQPAGCIISPAAKSKNISLLESGDIMKLGALVGDPCMIIFRLGPNSETPLVAAILNYIEVG